MVRLTSLKEHIETELEVECDDIATDVEGTLENFEFETRGASKELVVRTAL